MKNVRLAIIVALAVVALLCAVASLFAADERTLAEARAGDIDALTKVLDDPQYNIQYKARRWVDETNSYEIWYYNGLKKLGFEKMTLRVIWRWYPEGDTSKPQQEWHMVVHLDNGQAFWLMNQIANHFEGVSKHIEDNHCPDCLVRGRREP